MGGKVHRAEALTLVTLLAVGLVARLWGLGDQALWADEMFSWVRATQDSVAGFLAEAGNWPPLHFALLSGWIGLFGDSAEALRALSVLFGVVALGSLWALGRALFGPSAALVAVALAALAPAQVSMAQEVRAYTMVLALSAVLLLAAWRGFALADPAAPPRRAWVAVFVAVGILGLYTHFFVGLTLAATGCVGVMVKHRSRAAVIALVVAHGLILVAFLPWLPMLEGADAPTWLSPPDGAALFTLALLLGGAGFALAALSWGAMLLAPVFGVSIRPWAFGLALVVMPILLAVAVSHLLTPVLYPRYLSPTIPPLLALSGAGMAAVGRRFRAPMLVPVAVALGLGFWALVGETAYYDRVRKQDWRAIAAWMAERTDPENPPLMIACPRWPALRYHFRDGPFAAAQGVTLCLDTEPEARLPLSPQRPEAWVIAPRMAQPRLPASVLEGLEISHQQSWPSPLDGLHVVVAKVRLPGHLAAP